MQLKCPSCHAAFSLDVALGVDAARSALMRALQLPAPLAQLLAGYLGMFRASGRALSFVRAEKLMAELQPMLDAGSITRNGATRPCSQDVWRRALERIHEARDSGQLKLPLKSHGYLLEIAFGLADADDATAERDREAARRQPMREHTSATPAPAPVANVLRDRLYRIRGDLDLGLIDGAEAKRRAQLARQEVQHG